VTASVQPVGQGAGETLEKHYRNIYRHMMMMEIIMKYLDEAVCVRCHILVSFVWNMTKPTAISKSGKETLHITKLRTAWGLRSVTFMLLN
jgi:hypothetical protein